MKKKIIAIISVAVIAALGMVIAFVPGEENAAEGVSMTEKNSEEKSEPVHHRSECLFWPDGVVGHNKLFYG